MKAHPENKRNEALRLLQQNRGPKEVGTRLGIPPATIEDWAANWRIEGTLTQYKRAGMAHTNEAKFLSNGYYPSIRKRYLGMKWQDHLAKRTFGFKSPVEAIPYYLDESGNPRPCTYCGKFPTAGKVWGLDRLDSAKGHTPGNLVPCCGYHPSGIQLSCQASKSKYSLLDWMAMNMARAEGKAVSEQTLAERVKKVYDLASFLESVTH